MMMADFSNQMLATFAQSRRGNLTDRVKDLPTGQFVELLDQITREFEHFLQAIEMINTDSLETMLEQILEAFTLKIGQILQADRTTIFLVDQEKEQLWSKVAQSENGKPLELRLSIHAGIAGHVAQTGECLNIPVQQRGRSRNRLPNAKHPLYADCQHQEQSSRGGGAVAE
jgi:adenylate cyclase